MVRFENYDAEDDEVEDNGSDDEKMMKELNMSSMVPVWLGEM